MEFDSDTLGRLILSVPVNDNVVDLEDIYQICVAELFPDAEDPDNLPWDDRHIVRRLYVDIKNSLDFGYDWSYKGIPLDEIPWEEEGQLPPSKKLMDHVNNFLNRVNIFN